MDNDELYQKLTELFTSKINYDGEFYTLFLIEERQGRTKINFLNKQHYHYILMNLKNEILSITGSDVEFDYLNMKTSPITLKGLVQDIPEQIVKPPNIKKKEKVELPTIKNRTLKQVEDFMWKEYEKLIKEQKEIRKNDKNYLDDYVYNYNYGRIQMISNLYDYFCKIKDYEEE